MGSQGHFPPDSNYTGNNLERRPGGSQTSLEEAGADGNGSNRGQTCRTMGLGDVGSESPGERAKEQYTENPPGRTQDPGATAGQAGSRNCKEGNDGPSLNVKVTS